MNIVVDTSIIAKNIANIYGGDPAFLTLRSEREEVIEKVLEQVDYIVRRYDRVGRLLYAFDTGRSFRFSLPYGELYKSCRRAMKLRYNPEGYRTMIDELKHSIDYHGGFYVSADGIEADDIIYYLTTALYEQAKESSLVVSNDRDLQQLVCDDGEQFVAVTTYGKNHGHVVSNNFYIQTASRQNMSDVDAFFFQNDETEEVNRRIIAEKMIRVDPVRLLFTKIWSGDTSDSIPPVLQYSTKSGRRQNFTELRAERLFDEKLMGTNRQSLFEILKDDVRTTSLIEDSCRAVCGTTSQDDVIEALRRIQLNVSYIRLHWSVYPDDVFKRLEQVCLDCLERS